jgi:DNA-binding CsgD family transcriptional regulator
VKTADAEFTNPPRQALIGRDGELAEILRLVDHAAVRGGVLVVRGDAGIGKSALLEAASERAAALGAVIARTRGVQSEAQLPFAGLHQLLRPFLPHLDRLPAPQRRAVESAFGISDGDAPDVYLVGLASLGLLSEAATQGPLVLLVEDAQWLDPTSWDVVAFLARRVDVDPIVVLAAARSGVPSGVDHSGLPELLLTGLSDEAATQLLDRSAADPPLDLMARVRAYAAGNPLALIELPKIADALAAEIVGEPVPLTARLEQAFSAQLGELDPDQRALVLVAALDESELSVLVQAAELLVGHALPFDAWQAIAEAGLGTPSPAGFSFRHPLIRSAVQHATSSAERRHAHAALAEALGGTTDSAVWHRAAAASGPDKEIAEALDAAADRAHRRGASDAGIAAHERAAQLTADPQTRALRLAAGAQVALQVGRSAVSLRLYRAAIDVGLPPIDQLEASFYIEVLEGGWSGPATIRRIAAVAGDIAAAGEDRRALAALSLISLRAHWINIDSATRRQVTNVVRGLDVPLDDPLRLSVLALFDPIGNGPEVMKHLVGLSSIAVPDPSTAAAVGEAASALWAEDLAAPFLRAATAALRAQGRLTRLSRALVFESWADARRGAMFPAMTKAAEGTRLAGEVGHIVFAAAGKASLALTAGERGDDETFATLLSEAETTLQAVGAYPLLSLIVIARARQALATEQFSEAYEHLARLFDARDPVYHPLVRGWVLGDFAEAIARSGRGRTGSDALLDEWEEIARSIGTRLLGAQIDYARAVLADDDEAEERFKIALGSGSPYRTARAQFAYGAWLRRQRRLSDARAPLREALETFDSLGLTRRAEQANRELRASGETTRNRTSSTWAELTAQELQIARLAAEGLSNKEIAERLYLSPRTIGSHLYKIFPKLGITSRTQLRDALGPQLI